MRWLTSHECTPHSTGGDSQDSRRPRLVKKAGGRLVKHARYYCLRLARGARGENNGRRGGMAEVHGLGSCVRRSLAGRIGARCFEPSVSPLAFPARARFHLSFCIFLAGLSNAGAHRSRRNPTCQRISTSSGAFVRPLLPLAIFESIHKDIHWLAFLFPTQKDRIP